MSHGPENAGKEKTAAYEAQAASEEASKLENAAGPVGEARPEGANASEKAAELQAQGASGQEPGAEGKRGLDRAAIFKFAGLIAFFVLMGIIVAVSWPYISDVFSEGGVERLVKRMQDAGVGGAFVLLGMQFVQIIVAFIPGEVVQLAAGVMYGPWLGSFLILLGCVISSTVVYKLVHALGAPFVQGMVSTKHLDRFRKFEESGKLDMVVFILFLIPGMPKDVFTYLVPLTDMPYKKFIVLTTIGRTPGVVGSAYAAAGFANGEIAGPVMVLSLLVVIAVVAILFRDKIMGLFEREGD